ncbi:MAG: D-alanyl-D-alanine carboxypeptidase [uncultured Sphingomonas sp.]|uniref:serine-type D-Ala-D-Ala carboxypeptidase n=1 Tax=uncultured Sphingomonas sp. TaxID=158754 RepID=A0A6J4T8S9_9SPHN|nr:D-alanyl-D-alanine carboxypeptidase family protein [uncultured Sphingomonas sp.]CAA9516852.1 MAG: D-alanyl-D-alanine carboxypeptidase [uncultured Sphingomonas sp.]
MTATRLLLAATSLSLLATASPAAAPPFETPAKVAYLIDLSSGAELLAKNADQRMPPASMAKMMTTEVAFELIDGGKLPLGKMCTVRPETWQRWHGPQAGSTMFLSPNEQVSVENLLHGIVTLSGNDASVVLAECIAGTEQAFAAQMNELGRKLGLTGSNFGNSNGWPDEGVTYVTARDLAKLARASVERHPKLYKQFYGQPSFTWGKTLGSGEAITQGNRNPILGKIAGADGLKTGHTEEAGYGFTGSAEQNGRRLIMVVAGLTGFNQRIDESTKLMNWGFNAWQTKPLLAAGAKVGEAEVQLGDDDRVDLVAPKAIAVTYPAGLTLGDPRLKVRYNGPLKAPIAKGQQVAELVVTLPDGTVQRTPLTAAEAVEEAGFFGRFWVGLKQLVGLA